MQNTLFNFKSGGFILLIQLFFLVPICMHAHPYHIGVTEISLNTSKKQMNISCKLFLDDVQEAIFKSFHQKIDLSKEDSLGNALLAKYILAKVHLAFGHSAIQLIWKGYEIEEEAVWCYFYGKMNGNIQDLSVRNELLFECFDDQIHFIHCMYHEQRKSIKLHQQEPLGKFNF